MSADLEPVPTSRLSSTAAAPHRWRGRDITFFALAFIALNLTVPTLVSGLPLDFASADAVRALIATFAVQLALIALIVVLVRMVYGLELAEEMRWSVGYDVRNSSLFLLGMTLAFSVMIVSALFPPDNPPIQQLLTTPEAVLMFAVYAVAFAPLLEEVMFRGFLFRVLEQMAGPKVAVRTTAVVFGLLHVPQLWGSVAGMLVIFGVGYVLSEVRRRTDSLIPSLIVHTAYNGMIFAAFLLGSFAERVVNA